MVGIHVRLFHDYGSYKTIVLSRKGKTRIWLEEPPKDTGTNVVCLKCGKKYFIKYNKKIQNKIAQLDVQHKS